MNNNAGKTGLLISEDHPYFNLDDLDREKIYKQAEKLHWKITINDVHSEWPKIKNQRFRLYDGSTFSIERKKHLDHIIDWPHQNRPARNNLVLNLLKLSEAFIFEKHNVPDKTLENGEQKHPWVAYWDYYGLEIDGIRYFLNIFRHNVTGNLGLYTISDILAP